MPDTCCAALKADGAPCSARPLPGSDFCLFHDPAQAERLAESRSKGGSTPRRRIRRLPPILDHLHVAQLLSELFIEAMNHPETFDPKRLQALTNLARTLLKAVGLPRGSAFVHPDHSEPAATADHLLRIYAPAATEDEPLCELGQAAEKAEEQGGNRCGTGLPATRKSAGEILTADCKPSEPQVDHSEAEASPDQPTKADSSQTAATVARRIVELLLEEPIAVDQPSASSHTGLPFPMAASISHPFVPIRVLRGSNSVTTVSP